MPSPLRLLAFLLVFALGAVDVADAQILDRMRRAAQRGVERAVDREVTRQADRATAAAIAAAENAVVCAFSDEACIEDARQRGETVVLADAQGNPVDASGRPVATVQDAVVPAAPGTGVWVNYDFVPGERVLFAEDFGQDRVGDFPRRLELVRGNWEVAEWQGRRLLRHTGPRHAAVKVTLPETLPDQFTIEFDVFFPHGNQQLWVAMSEPEGVGLHASPQYRHNYVQVDGRATGVEHRDRGGVKATNEVRTLNAGLVPVRIMADGSYVKVYVGSERVANVPNADLPRTRTVWIQDTNFADQENPIYLSDLRIAAGGRDLYAALAAEGHVATRGVLFDTGSARIRPESTPTLAEITRMLEEHPDLRLRIEGHTDATGAAATNQALSERRAAAVRDHLVRQGIAAGRLEAVGEGQERPVADNGTPEGRQQNRRVELVRL